MSMLHHQYKELWETRFRKILELEKDSYHFYKNLLERNKTILEGTRIKNVLEQIMHEESQHARIAHELLRLVRTKRIQAWKKKSGVDGDGI